MFLSDLVFLHMVQNSVLKKKVVNKINKTIMEFLEEVVEISFNG